jgi:hypothetical protein
MADIHGNNWLLIRIFTIRFVDKHTAIAAGKIKLSD